MDTKEKTAITVSALIHASIDKVWRLWTQPKHIRHWNQASDDWHTPKANNDFRVGGNFLYRMETKDDRFGFDFSGVYDEIRADELIAATLDDGRRLRIEFTNKGNKTKVSETFDAEEENSVEIQQDGWQAILDNFKKYAEADF
jgi:uncharacterized protein YndB with AHSA1/START domain